MDVIDIIYPKKCLNCGREGKYICANCLEKVNPASFICPVCLKPSIDGMAHKECLSFHSPRNLTSLWEYDGVIRKAILALKYKFARKVADEISEIAIERLYS